MAFPPHPQEFYVAHRVYIFSSRGKNYTEWGTMTDGPEEYDVVVERIAEWINEWRRQSWRGNEHVEPSLASLKVWHIKYDAPPRDVTEYVLGEAEYRVD